jgi:endonuclease YncB( thermonuclease family)
MLKNGLAWYEKKYAPKRKDYEMAMKKAQDEKRGLWFDDKPIRPTDFRHHKEQNLAQAK